MAESIRIFACISMWYPVAIRRFEVIGEGSMASASPALESPEDLKLLNAHWRFGLGFIDVVRHTKYRGTRLANFSSSRGYLWQIPK